MIGKIKDITYSLAGETIVSLSLEDGKYSVPGLTKLFQSGDRLSIKIGKYRKKRSLDANAYHWLLCGKIAAALETDQDSVHYDLMVRYGTILTDDSGNTQMIRAIPEVNLRRCNVYARMIKNERDRDGNLFYIYALIKPSREYDSKEMAQLIKGTISEAEEMGIGTLTPAELAEMMGAMREHEK